MKERTLKILATLIQDFVETGVPIASKRMLEHKQFPISSATIRNEFSILEEIGLIHSPHISAGKIPTEKGYRFFVDELLEMDKEAQQVKEIFSKYVNEYKFQKSKETIFDVLRVVSNLSENVAFAVVDNDKTAYLGLSNVFRKPEFLQSPEKIADIIEIFEGQERLHAMLNALPLQPNNVRIFIGKENLLKEISSCTVIVSRFEKQAFSGYIGILGPIRMKYGFNKALIQNALEML